MKQFLLCLLAGLLLLALGASAQQNAAEKPKREPAPVVTLTGTVKELAQQEARGVAFTLATDTKTERVMTAPKAYLDKIGLTLTAGTTVTVTGQETTARGTTVMQARTIIVDTKTYVLRDEKGKPQWNEFVGLEEVTVTGTVKDLVVPTPAAPAADGTKPKAQNMMVTFTLATDKGSYQVMVCPAPYLTASGILLKADATVTVAGWVRTVKKSRTEEVKTLVARVLTIDGKEYTLRDADGKAAWQQRQPAAQKRNGGRRGDAQAK